MTTLNPLGISAISIAETSSKTLEALEVIDALNAAATALGIPVDTDHHDQLMAARVQIIAAAANAVGAGPWRINGTVLEMTADPSIPLSGEGWRS